MTGQQKVNPSKSAQETDHTASDIANRALREVALRARNMKRHPDPTAVARIYEAATSDDPLACSAVVRDLMANGIPSEQICDIYIPEVARRFGSDWVEADRSFSSVTIGTARLQYVLREIGTDRSGEARWGDSSMNGAILLLLAPKSDHTLGIMVLAQQLRRRGFSVKLSIGDSKPVLADLIRSLSFDAVFLSASTFDGIEALAESVSVLRSYMNPTPPIVLGGFVVETSDRKALSASGVDKVTNILDEALEFCRLPASLQNI